MIVESVLTGIILVLIALLWRRHDRAARSAEAATARLRASEEKFSALFRASPLPLLVTTESDGRVIEANDAAESLSGVTGSTLIGQNVLELGAYSTADARTEYLAGLGHAEAVAARELELPMGGGRTRLMLSHTARIRYGTTSALLTALTDITELRRLEERLLAAQRMEAIGQISGGVAHEFNNLLMVIQGHADALAHSEKPKSESMRHIGAIHRAVAQAGQITGGLLTFARRQPVESAASDLHAVIGELVPMIEGLLARTTTLAIRLCPRPSPVPIDRSQVAQLLINLTLNAREAMPEGGRLTISTAHINDPGAVPGDASAWVELSIQDTGCGMTDEVRRHIFEPFFSTKPPGHGTGLGLSICYGIVEQARGRIEADSAVGRGTTIRIVLPLGEVAEERPATGEDIPAPVTGQAGQVVLLVEDEPDVREIVAEVLAQAGYVVVACEDLNDVKSRLTEAERPPNLLLTDLVLPSGSGLDVARFVNERYPTLPVLFMSGYSDAVYNGDSTALHLLQKPFTSAALVRKVREMLETQPA